MGALLVAPFLLQAGRQGMQYESLYKCSTHGNFQFINLGDGCIWHCRVCYRLNDSVLSVSQLSKRPFQMPSSTSLLFLSLKIL